MSPKGLDPMHVVIKEPVSSKKVDSRDYFAQDYNSRLEEERTSRASHDSTKDRLNHYKQNLIHSKQIVDALKKRPLDMYGKKFRVMGDNIQVNMDFIPQQRVVKEEKLIHTEDFVKNKRAFIPLKM